MDDDSFINDDSISDSTWTEDDLPVEPDVEDDTIDAPIAPQPKRPQPIQRVYCLKRVQAPPPRQITAPSRCLQNGSLRKHNESQMTSELCLGFLSAIFAMLILQGIVSALLSYIDKRY